MAETGAVDAAVLGALADRWLAQADVDASFGGLILDNRAFAWRRCAEDLAAALIAGA